MLPACRSQDEGFPIPRLDLTPSDVDGFIEELGDPDGVAMCDESGFPKKAKTPFGEKTHQRQRSWPVAHHWLPSPMNLRQAQGEWK